MLVPSVLKKVSSAKSVGLPLVQLLVLNGPVAAIA